MKSHVNIFFCIVLTLLYQNSFAQVNLFEPSSSVKSNHASEKLFASQTDAVGQSRRYVELNSVALSNSSVGDVVGFLTPEGARYNIIYDRTEQGLGGFVWVGHVQGYDPGRYPVHISILGGKTVGTIATETGIYSLIGPVQKAEYFNSRQDAANVNDDQVVSQSISGSNPISGKFSTVRNGNSGASVSFSPATAGVPSQIDTMVLYTTGYATAVGGDAIAKARVNQIIATANTAFSNSGIYVTLRLVYAGSISYPDSVGLGQTLNDLQSGTADSRCTQYGTSSISAVPALRNQYGADLVSLLVAGDVPIQACGSTYGIGASGLATLGNPSSDPSGNLAFSVSIDFYTVGKTFGSSTTHEIGHNFGSVHDPIQNLSPFLNNTPQGGDYPGNPSYNKGYCNGNAGTIMAYQNPQDGCPVIDLYFSAPTVSACHGLPCGVPVGQSFPIYWTGVYSGTSTAGADNATAMNINAPYIANFRPAVPIVTASSGPNGSMSPTGSVVAPNGGSVSFTVTPNPGYVTKVGGTCGGILNGNTYVTNPVTTGCTVFVTFVNVSPIVSILLDDCDATTDSDCTQ